jgi:GLPGLI family protein
MIKNILLLSVIFFMNYAFGQNQSGQVTYIGSLNQKYIDSILKDMETKDIPMSHKKFSIDAYNNAADIELILKFKDQKSYYYYNPNLETENGYNTTEGIVSTMAYYNDNASNRIIELNRYVGNISHKPLKWKLTNKTKKIGKYLCYQAIATEELYSRKGYFYNEKVIAWFSPEISLNYGPKFYIGLPGLVLEIQKKKFSIIATKINLNPSKEVKFKVPTIGKVITKEESYKRYKEMIEDRKNN